jgi:hypothetical protein
VRGIRWRARGSRSSPDPVPEVIGKAADNTSRGLFWLVFFTLEQRVYFLTQILGAAAATGNERRPIPSYTLPERR